MLGHTIQNCAKLSTANKAEGQTNVPKKHPNVNNKVVPKSSLHGKKDLNAPGSNSMFDKRSEAPKISEPELVNKMVDASVVKVPAHANVVVNAPATGYQTASTPDHTDLNEDSFDSADDFEEGEFQDMTESGVHNIEHPALVHHKPIAGNLKLHNSFELLETSTEQVEHVTGQAISGDKESTLILLDMYTDKNPDVEDNSQPAALSSGNHVLDSVNGRQTFPITATAVLLGDARDPFFMII